jgi:insertion element IS1 protein InsB
MECPKCNSNQTFKNGNRRGKQSFRCRRCGRQFVLNPKNQPYSSEVKQLCMKMYLNGMGLRAIERVTEIHHTTVINWIQDAGIKLPDAPQEEEIPEITEVDELQTPTQLECIQAGMRGAFRTFVANKKNKVWLWTIVNHWKSGIILWTVGDRMVPNSRPLINSRALH